MNYITTASTETLDQARIDPSEAIDKGYGQPLLLLHGLFGALSNWRRVLSHFSKDYRVIIPHLPIYEGSNEEATLEHLVSYLDGFIHKHALGDDVTLIGNSLGGHAGLLFALKYPDKVKRLVLTGSSGLYENMMSNSFPRVKDYEFVRQKVSYTFYNKKVITKRLVDEIYTTVQSASKTIRLIRLARSAQRNNLAEALHQIQIPTLLIWGMNDEITPVNVAWKFLELIPDAELKLINECGHVPMMEHPRLFNTYLSDFLLKHKSRFV